MLKTTWYNNAIIYQIIIDRFYGVKKKSNAAEFLGGNLNGITKKLDYLIGLGINVIWLSPFYESHQYHGYHVTDFEKVDPHFGTTDDLKKLISKSHEKGIKVIADFVPNHCSVHHPFFADATSNKNSNYRKWFYFKDWPDNYLSFLNFKELPKINLDNKEARNYMIETAKYWLSLGLDGYRLDHVIGPSHSFWKEFSSAIKNEFPNSILIGEAWFQGSIDPKLLETVNFSKKLIRRFFGVSQEKIQLEYYKELDGILDFKLHEMIVEAISNDVDINKDRLFLKKVKKHLKKYRPDYLPFAFLDNHDMDRFLRICKGNTDTLLDTYRFLLSLNIPVIIYYATENGVYNEISISCLHSQADLYVREPFDWKHRNEELYNQLSRLFKKH